MYDRIEAKMKGVQQALYSRFTVSTTTSTSEGIEVGDEPTQLCRLADAIEAHPHQIQEEK
jgi:hypothetical protein